jgi:hypothetical protein
MQFFGIITISLDCLICFAMIACDGSRAIEVELDAFSGRPNPKWTLSGEKSSQLLRKIDSLHETGDAPHPPDLGFRGFVLKSGDRSIRVYGGRIAIETAGAVRVYRDTAGIQAELTEEARQRGFEAIVVDSSPR